MRAAPLLLSLLFVVPPGPAAALQDPPVVVLRPGDAVRLEFLPERAALPGPEAPGAGRVYAVDDEGVVLLPVAGRVQVGGRPFSAVRAEVTSAFAREFVEGFVRLTPLLRVAVLGEVRTPGLVSADPTMALADVLAAAGGLTQSADRQGVRLVRTGSADVVVPADELASVGIALRSGDRVVVPRRSWVAENSGFLLGAGASVVAAVLTALIVR
ncbi:MAG: SLBB domain-containing protein [Longimicrobiales bacterium]